jgi:protein-tyrosine phosphatase
VSLADRIRSLFGGTPAPRPSARDERIDRVAPWLYIGPALPADRVADLVEQGITHVLDLREEGSDDPALMEQLGIRWRRIPIADRVAPEDEQLEAILDWLDREADTGRDQAVYVHCHAGLGRTPTIAIALLMQQELTLAEARRIVFAARPEVSPTEPQMDWLELLEARLAPSRASRADRRVD